MDITVKSIKYLLKVVLFSVTATEKPWLTLIQPVNQVTYKQGKICPCLVGLGLIASLVLLYWKILKFSTTWFASTNMHNKNYYYVDKGWGTL